MRDTLLQNRKVPLYERKVALNERKVALYERKVPLEHPQVSVVVPVYNGGDTIAACIDSILANTAVRVEVCVVDDGSTDGTAGICDHYAAQDGVCVVHQPNRGRSAARWAGVERCRGEWVTFVDADDTLPANALALLLAKASDDVDIVLGNGHLLTSDQRTLIPMPDFRHLAVRGYGTIGVPWGSLYRRSLLTPYVFDLPRDIFNGEDYIFWLRMVFATQKPVAIVRESVYIKGADHTSNSFVGTADYSYRLNELRKASIPDDCRQLFMADMLSDRITNLFAVAVSCRKNDWASSTFYNDILSDMKACGTGFTAKQSLFLHLPARWLRRLYSWGSNWISKMK